MSLFSSDILHEKFKEYMSLPCPMQLSKEEEAYGAFIAGYRQAVDDVEAYRRFNEAMKEKEDKKDD